MIGFVKDAFNTIKDFIVDTMMALPGLVFSLALSIGTTIFNAILQGLGFLTEIHGRIIGTLLDILGEIPGIALDIGKGIFDGIVSAIGEIGEAIWNKIPKPLRDLLEGKIDVGALLPDIPGAGIVGDVAGFISDPRPGFLKHEGALEIKGPGDQLRGLEAGEMVLPRDSAQVLRDFFSGGAESERSGRGDINVTVHNPQPEAAEDTLRRRLQALAQLGIVE